MAVVNIVLNLANQKLSAFFPFQLVGLESPNVLHQDLSHVFWVSIRQFFDKSDYQIIFLTRFVLGFDLPKHIKLSDRSKYIKLSDRSRLRNIYN